MLFYSASHATDAILFAGQQFYSVINFNLSSEPSLYIYFVNKVNCTYQFNINSVHGDVECYWFIT